MNTVIRSMPIGKTVKAIEPMHGMDAIEIAAEIYIGRIRYRRKKYFLFGPAVMKRMY